MDFFEAQARAKRRTTRLVLLFALAVTGTIAAGYAAAILILGQAGPRAQGFEDDYWRYQHRGTWSSAVAPTHWWDPQLLVLVAGGTIAIVGLASLFKWLGLRRGGSAVAEMAGGRAIEPQTTDVAERRLLNVVEEMAIASGVPMPEVYVLDDEPCINAFAAGLTSNDAVVAVTRGTLEKLTRDELQGVIGHEFSHILNGDMRLNVRITAVVFGILVIGLIGRSVLWSTGRGRIRVGRNRDRGGGGAAILAIGLALMLIGYVGYFFGRLIQAAVSRQREFLADASSVQFTRNPAGISGALKKIGGFAIGGNLQTSKSAELGHFFFAQGFRSMFGGLWATHPPLAERIRAVDPSWDGRFFEPPEAVDVAHESFADAGFGGRRFAPAEALQHVHAAAAEIPPARPPPAAIPFHPATVAADVGALTETHIRRAQGLLEAMPSRLREAARDPALAPSVVYALLLAAEPGRRDSQLAIVSQHAGQDAAAALAPLRALVSVLDPAVRLPLVQLCAPALRSLDDTALDRFLATLDELVHSDHKVSPFEFALQKMLVHHLELARQETYRGRDSHAAADAGDIALVLSALSRIGSRDTAAAEAAYRAGLGQLGSRRPPPSSPVPAPSLESLDAALDRLAEVSLREKQALLVAAAHTIGFDGTVTTEEADLFRAISASIDCPVPPLH